MILISSTQIVPKLILFTLGVLLFCVVYTKYKYVIIIIKLVFSKRVSTGHCCCVLDGVEICPRKGIPQWRIQGGVQGVQTPALLFRCPF